MDNGGWGGVVLCCTILNYNSTAAPTAMLVVQRDSFVLNLGRLVWLTNLPPSGFVASYTKPVS